MIDLIKSEWIKMRTVRVNFVLTTIAAAFPLIVIALIALLSNDAQRTADDLVDGVTGTMVLTALLLGVIGALNLTGEFSHQTIRVTYAATPQRSKVLIAKAVITLIATLAMAAVIAFFTYLVGSLILSGRDAEVTLSGNDKAALLGVIVLSGLLALLGYGLGLLIRNSPATVTILILWPLLLENIARAVLSAAGVEDPTPWLPYQSAITMAKPDLDLSDPGRVQGGLYMAAVVLAFILIGLIVNERRDA